jgi:hypothetical protein
LRRVSGDDGCEFGVFVAVEASPRAVTSPGWEWQTGIFLGGSPEDFAPPFSQREREREREKEIRDGLNDQVPGRLDSHERRGIYLG